MRLVFGKTPAENKMYDETGKVVRYFETPTKFINFVKHRYEFPSQILNDRSLTYSGLTAWSIGFYIEEADRKHTGKIDTSELEPPYTGL